ncbi:glucosamine-6-phosphate deaminase [Clavibacter michiganensis]|uniref:Glucosamine-6-phosphate deaminase n=1 Tax=Clavibacter michiganensis TaxID=28447 RepID=A0A2S5VUU7_9MICO|nr:glucosamine-6-phosphate deaminase [Clavibacter michiganensis]PPF52336.1 glucosamine-6-phosphate deaminase [Clavibacter michiganensis]PPF68082.1 glucosamine-6-phosphate deaminase [Clavibacter michiganensis]
MQVVIRESAEEVGRYAADVIRAGARDGSLRVLGVATGSSPLPVYRALADGADGPDREALAGLTAFALDEYVGLAPDHPEGYRAVVDREVTRRLGLDPARVHVPDGRAEGIRDAGDRYEALIREAGGIDLQILGIGATGHIGFNEPTSSFASRTRIKTLTPETRADNARFFDTPDEVPVHCITQGLGTILDARRVVLVAHGAAKAAAVAAAVEGPLTSMCPGSALQLHPDAVVVVDEAAAAQLALADYHRFVFDHRPEWQR